MWRWNTAVALLLTLMATAARAEDGETSLIAQKGWVRFQIVLGRVEVSNLPSSQTRSASLGEPNSELYEKLLLSADTEIPSLRYERRTPTSAVSIEVVNGNRVEIIRQPLNNSDESPLHFRQLPGRDLVLTVGAGDTRRTYRAAGLWHLLFEAPDVAGGELGPILEAMQPTWDFDNLTRRAQDEMIRQAQVNSFTTWRTARKLIAQLDSRSFSQRQEAADRLRAIGVGLLPYLDRVDPIDLSREQRARLQQIRESLSPKTPDSPQRIAAWLAEDERAWLTMLDHGELPIRQMAADHLAKRLPRRMKFDPAADEAVRAAQIAQLKSQLWR